MDKSLSLILQIAERVAATTVTGSLSIPEILRKYPQRNDAWDLVSGGKTFASDASDLGPGAWHDPWGRPTRQEWFTAKRDREGEVIFWNGFTTVDGNKVELVIYND